MYDDVELKIKRKNKVLFTRDSLCLQELLKLIRLQTHKTLVLWAFCCVEEVIKIYNGKYQDDFRPTIAYETCKKWASGEIKMKEAKRCILECHSIAKEIDDDYYIAICHAIGQGLSTVHVETHAIGLVMYELTAIVLKNRDNYEEKVNDKIRWYIKTLKYFADNVDNTQDKWASFLEKNIPNKEMILYNKKLLVK